MKFYVSLLMTTSLLCCKAKKDEQKSTTEILQSKEVAAYREDTSHALQKSKVALPGVNFGISLKEYQSANKYMLQGFGSNTYFVKPFFDNESELFKIELSGLSRNASYSDTKLWEDHTNLVKFFEADNGAPKILAVAPKLTEIKPGEVKWTHSWSISSKRIKVGIAEGTTGETYEVKGWVYDKSMLDKKKAADSLMLHPEKKATRKLRNKLRHMKKQKNKGS
ncbi:hypothetical protein [Dyadobacter crusticola]|uniref:hypothetical protein n=1 Tax=Dyadobacter crusticola TaxID=292407 RepID=UPI0004E0D6EC|nr:hypothetical protein [Dyadobacter crusticola]